jgi:hypothetical protein
MHHDILDVIRNVQDLYENNTSLAVLKDFERVIDELDTYVFENWGEGEIAYGPKVERHWITVGFMWPREKMPDPNGGKRLMEAGCKITYQKSHLVEPRKIRMPEDLRPGTKKGKLDRHPIWIVEIRMPKKVAFDVYRGYMDKMKGEYKEEAGPTQGQAAPGQPAPVTPPVGGMPPPSGAPGGMPAPGGAPGGMAGGAPAPAPAV